LFLGIQTENIELPLKILALSLIPIIINTVFYNILNAYGHTKVNANIILLGVLVNLILNLTFIYYFTMIGAAFSTLFTEIFIVVSLYYAEKKYTRFTY
jgi:O-antigen/teichoic acid export membrane protein